MKRFLLVVLVLTAVKIYSAQRITINQGSQPIIDASCEKLKNLSDDYTFREQTSVELPNGKIRRKLQQYYKGVPVWDAAIVVKDKAKADNE